MKTLFHLKNCTTCKKILALYTSGDWELREIKSQPISSEELEAMYQKTKSYEALFSKKSMQIKARGINLKSLKEEDFRDLLLEHYSFLKRPVFLTNEQIFVGSDKKNLDALSLFLGKRS